MNTIEKNKSLGYYLIVLAIYISIFINSYVFFKQPFEFYFGYLIYIVLLPVFIQRYGFNRNLIFIFSILLLTGVFNIVIGNNTAALFFKVFLGLFLSYFFYYYVILEFNYDVEQLFKWYLKGAYIVSLIGIAQLVFFTIGFKQGYTFFGIFNKWGLSTGGFFGLRINSVFAEPTHLATVFSAAFFFSVYNLFIKEPMYISKVQSLVIIAVYFLSFSGVGQLGIFLAFLLLLLNFGLIRYIFVLIPLFIILFNVLYNNVPEFHDRFESLTGLFSGEKFELGKTHGSSFILYNNYVVTLENFKTNFLFGGGIGSHPVAFEKYSIAKDIKVYGFNNNSADANSMFLRLLSETGLFGVSIFLFIIFKFYVSRDENHDTYHWLVSNGILIMILLNLFRQGHYFLNGFPFFVLLYIYNSISYNNYLEEQVSDNSPLTPEEQTPS
ncbi:MAG: hypothetical protein KF900_12295 [Bacteroidetes bacterium]|nr:hypothetical protein [Bacteroidota bacterium]